MGEGDDFEAADKVNEYDVVRERVDGHLSNVLIVNARHTPANLRKRLDQFERSSGLCHESLGNAWVAVAIPRNNFTVSVSAGSTTFRGFNG